MVEGWKSTVKNYIQRGINPPGLAGGPFWPSTQTNISPKTFFYFFTIPYL